jgi:hypothetical protein
MDKRVSSLLSAARSERRAFTLGLKTVWLIIVSLMHRQTLLAESAVVQCDQAGARR